MKIEPTQDMQIELAQDLAESFAVAGADPELTALDILDSMAVAGHALVPDFGGVTSPAYFALLAQKAGE